MSEEIQRQIWKARILKSLSESAEIMAFSIDTAGLLKNEKLQHNLNTLYRAIVCVVQYPENTIEVTVE